MHKRLIILAIISALFFFPMIYITWKTNATCDSRIIMEDGTEYTAVRVFHTNGGMTWLKDCQGNEKRFPTVNIKIIEKINQ